MFKLQYKAGQLLWSHLEKQDDIPVLAIKQQEFLISATIVSRTFVYQTYFNFNKFY